MKRNIERGCWAVVCVVLGVPLFGRLREGTKIAIGSRLRFEQMVPWLGTHLGPENFVQVGARRFTGVVGRVPFFLTVRGSDLIVFVTLTKSGRVLNVVRPRSGEVLIETPIKSAFGSLIGRGFLEPNEYEEAVLLPSGMEIALVHSGAGGRFQSIVDLNSKLVLDEVDIGFEVR